MTKISGLTSFKRTVLGHDGSYYLKKGQEYLDRARAQQQSGEISRAHGSFVKAQEKLNKILAGEKTEEVKTCLGQVLLEHGDLLRKRGSLTEARVCYENAKAYSQEEAEHRLTELDARKTNLVQKSRPQALLATSLISVKPPESLKAIQIDVNCFKDNPLPRVIEDYALVEKPDDIKNTYHLAKCLNASEGALSPALMKLAREIVERFGHTKVRDKDLWQEVIPLATIANDVLCRHLIGEALDSVAKQEGLLNPLALQSLAVMIRNLPEILLKKQQVSAGDLVKLLEALVCRLKSVHKQGNTLELQFLLHTTSQVLDAMAKAGVTSISRTEMQEPLDEVLSSLRDIPELRFQAYYARQALMHIPNDESRWQEIWRRGMSIAEGAASLASAVRTFDPNKLLETFDHFSEAFCGAVEKVKHLVELTNEMQGFKSNVQEAGLAIRDSLTKERQYRWYAALQFLDTCLEEGLLIQFEQFVRRSEFSRNEAFLLGVCQRLEHLVRTQKEAAIQEGALQFLGELAQNESQQWGSYKGVQQAVCDILGRLEKVALPESIRTQAKAVLAQFPANAQQVGMESEVDCYIGPVWDPAWQQVGTQLLYKARGDDRLLNQIQDAVLREQRDPLALLGVNKDQEIEALRVKYAEELEEVDEVKDALAMYVAPQCKLSAAATEQFDLESKVDEFLVSEKKVLLLLGEAGSGKSTFNRYLARRLWEEYKKTEHSKDRPIPLFIPLSTLKDPSENLISEYLTEQGLSKAQIEVLRKAKKFIFILDGYDEIAQRSRAFYTNNKLEKWQAKVIISSRPEYLGERYQSKFHPVGKPSSLEEYRLAPFSDESVKHYIDKYVSYSNPGWGVEAYEKVFKEVAELKELARTPFMLKIALEVLPSLDTQPSVSKGKLTRVVLYDKFVENWFGRSQERLGRIKLTEKEQEVFDRLAEEDFTAYGLVFSQKLAVQMYQEKAVFVKYSGASDIKQKDWKQGYFGNKNEETRLLRFNAPLIRQGERYWFIHKSMQDYFVARALWEEFNQDKKLEASSKFNRLTIVNDAAVVQFLVERVKQDAELKEKLLGVVESTKAESKFGVGGANAITVLVRAGVQFIGMDLKGIQIPGADLSHGVFDSAQLQGSDLRNVNLRTSWLYQANLSGAQMFGVQFGEWPYLEEESEVGSCAYSPDGTTCATGLLNGVISVYNTLNWEKIYTLQGHEYSINSIAYSPNGQQLASGSSDNTVRLWDADSGAAVRTLEGHTDAVWSVAYSPSGLQLASGSYDNTVRLWDADSGAAVRTLEGHTDYVFSVVYSPSGLQIASGSRDNTVRLWDAESGAAVHTLEGHTSWVRSVVYSPSGSQIASGSDDMTVRLWEAESGAAVHTLEGHTWSVTSVVYSPSGLQLASGSYDNTVRLWDADSGAAVHTLEGHADYVYSVVYSPSGLQLASGSMDKTVRLWDAQSGAAGHTLEGHTDYVYSVVYSPSGSQLASGSRDNTVRLWDAQSGAAGHTLEGHTFYVFSVAYSPSGLQLASGSWDRTVRLWDADSGAAEHTLEGHTERVSSVVYSPSGLQLASGSFDNTVRLWDAESGAAVHTLEGHTYSVNSVVYSPSGLQLASGSFDNTVRLWDAESGAAVHTLKGHKSSVTSVVYSPSGLQLASGSDDKTVRLWDAHSGAAGHTLKGHKSSVTSVVYSSSGAQIASGSEDTTVRLWEVVSGECLRVIECFSSGVNSVAWKETPEGAYLLTGSYDNLVRKWEVIAEGGGYNAQLRWMSPHGGLKVTGSVVGGMKGLSERNLKLLKQRGAVVEPLLNSLVVEESSPPLVQ